MNADVIRLNAINLRFHLSSLLFVTLLVAIAIAGYQNAPTLTLSIVLLVSFPIFLIGSVARRNQSMNRAKGILVGITLLVAFYFGSIGPYAAVIYAVPDEHISTLTDVAVTLGAGERGKKSGNLMRGPVDTSDETWTRGDGR